MPEAAARHFLRRRDRRLGRRASRPRRIVFLLKVLGRLPQFSFCQVSGELPVGPPRQSVAATSADSFFDVVF